MAFLPGTLKQGGGRHDSVILVLGRWRQEGHKFKVILDYIVNLSVGYWAVGDLCGGERGGAERSGERDKDRQRQRQESRVGKM